MFVEKKVWEALGWVIYCRIRTMETMPNIISFYVMASSWLHKMWPFAFALKKQMHHKARTFSCIQCFLQQTFSTMTIALNGRWMSVVMFYLVQLFLMPSATSDVLHDLESPSFINFVCLLNIAHAFWLTLNCIRLERVWSGPAVALRLSKTFHFRTPSKNPSNLPVECPFYGSF